MPSNYAHFRFGTALLETMPGDIRRTVCRYRRLYDVGLHGPDIFFYCNPLLPSRSRAQARKFHAQSGKDFFPRVCRNLRLQPSEAAYAYLFGVLAHYCLDSVCHPVVLEAAKEGIASHLAIETEFDRFLLEADGKIPAYTYDSSPHIRLTQEECKVVPQFYPGTNSRQIQEAVRNMAQAVHLLAGKNAGYRTVMEKSLQLTAGAVKDVVMPRAADPAFTETNEKLMVAYTQAQEKAARAMNQLGAHLTYNAPLGEDFFATFNG